MKLGGRVRNDGVDGGMHMEKDLPSVRTGLEEEGDVAGGDNFGGHADDETDHAHADGTDDVPELLFGVSGMYRVRVAIVDMN
jgi:hypothetical protein